MEQTCATISDALSFLVPEGHHVITSVTASISFPRHRTDRSHILCAGVVATFPCASFCYSFTATHSVTLFCLPVSRSA